MASKTNAMRLLDAKKIDYQMMGYDNQDGKIDGLSVAEKIGKSPESVFKTLVAHGAPQHVYVFVIPVREELDLKKAAKAAGEKKIEMLHVKDLLKWTGYIRGGCSPIGMKKLYPTFVDDSAKNLDTIIVSGGKIGTQIELTVENLIAETEAKVEALTK
ncbi:Cys-tRNA(Pro) deacylase [Peribacillus asahii]|uniref:Cys-tRNA(Pro) deacylase n=1 Tax=Peribacillus asahii TaxID=228899 RepID=UPI00207A48FE|nr:Cys-tRNA(Pro) deacylase [Peribacillus asahii]USK59734.1 Cys-tRNA(Pro) deacylase [Peribacillus asahii]